jgi:exodeoxyribonuclease III
MKTDVKGGGSPVRLISWNVNGVRAILKKGLLEFIAGQNPDILCLQETRARPEQVADVLWPDEYTILVQFWNPGKP